MTRRSATTTIPFGAFGLGQGVYADDLAAVAEMTNYAGARNPEALAGLASGTDAIWGDPGSPETHGIAITGAATVYEMRLWIDAGWRSVRLAAEVWAAVGTSAEVSIFLGSAAAVLSFTGSAGPDLQTADMAVSTIGSGWVDVSIAVDRTAGSGTAELLTWSLFAMPIEDVDLPAPPDE
jgi:hypothetical protein